MRLRCGQYLNVESIAVEAVYSKNKNRHIFSVFVSLWLVQHSVLLKVNHIGVCLYLLVMTLFMMSVEVRSPLIMESITVPCLKILLKLVKPPSPSSKTNKVGFFFYTTGILDISKQTFADVNVLFFRLIGRFCPFLKQTSKPANKSSKTIKGKLWLWLYQCVRDTSVKP